jgi:hypothetical protein
MGIDHFANVDCVVLWDQNRVSQALTHLKQLTTCRSLILQFNSTQLTDEEIVQLATLMHLRELAVQLPKETDRLLAGVQRLGNLESLRLVGGDRVGDEGLQHIGRWTRLRRLNIGIDTGNDGLAPLVGLTRLVELGLIGRFAWEPAPAAQIGDAGLLHLAGLKSLRSLVLMNHPGISDEGLVHLRGLTELRELDLTESNVTDAGLADLQKALPKCRMIH